MKRKLTFVLELTDDEIKEMLCKMSGKLFSDDELNEHLSDKVLLNNDLFEDSEEGSFTMCKGFLLGLSIMQAKINQ